MPTQNAASVITALEASARDLCSAAEKMPSRAESAGQKLVQAVRAKLPTRQQPLFSPVVVSAAPEGFTEKVKEAVKRKLGSQQKQHKDRYRHKPRKQTKGE